MLKRIPYSVFLMLVFAVYFLMYNAVKEEYRRTDVSWRYSTGRWVSPAEFIRGWKK